MDKAGRSYWDHEYATLRLPPAWDGKNGRLSQYHEYALYQYIRDGFERHGLLSPGLSLIEAGCGRSTTLPMFSKVFGFQVAGIDYSADGCDQARRILDREQVSGEVYCEDLFRPPDKLVERFDALVSFGLVEHFTDTSAVLCALAQFVKPGGVLFTNIPNICGFIGSVQKLINRSVYDVHVPLTPSALCQAHKDAGCTVLECGHFMSTNFGVLNMGCVPSGLTWWVKKVVVAALTRVSMGVWLFERVLGPAPASQLFSPYIHCLARKKQLSASGDHNPCLL